MKTARKSIALVAVLMLTMSLVACGSSSIIGTWEKNNNGMTVEYTFEKDGTCKTNMLDMTIDGTYKLDGEMLTITMNFLGKESSDVCKYRVEGDKLTIISTNENGEIEQVFIKK